MTKLEENRVINASKVYIITTWYGQIKFVKCFKDKCGVFRIYATGGTHTFQEHKIKFIANTKEELAKIAPEYFI